MKKPLLTVLLASIALTPLAALAGDGYFGAALGRSENKLNLDGYPQLKDSGTGYKLFGGYLFNEHFGLEGGVANLRKSTLSGAGYTVTGEPQSYYLAGRAALPIGNRFELYGKVGAARTHTRLNVTGNVLVSAANNQTSPLLGVGAAFMFDKQVAAVIEYDDFGKMIKEQGVALKGNLVSAGFRISF